MIIARRGLKVKVMDQANAVGPTSIEGSLFSSGVNVQKTFTAFRANDVQSCALACASLSHSGATGDRKRA